ncbi:MAG TPA: hypothetical protein VKD72_23785 [Gemmataceae bacterium]|nr:hypothetical protein [Gemmataceae bacterium]
MSALLDAVARRVVAPTGSGRFWMIDGNPLAIGGCSKDRQTGYGRATGGKAKGYKLDTLAGSDGSLAAWRVGPMNKDERVLAERLPQAAPSEVVGYMIGDANFDSNELHRVCAERGELATGNAAAVWAGQGDRAPPADGGPSALDRLDGEYRRRRSPSTTEEEAAAGPVGWTGGGDGANGTAPRRLRVPESASSPPTVATRRGGMVWRRVLTDCPRGRLTTSRPSWAFSSSQPYSAWLWYLLSAHKSRGRGKSSRCTCRSARGAAALAAVTSPGSLFVPIPTAYGNHPSARWRRPGRRRRAPASCRRCSSLRALATRTAGRAVATALPACSGWP